jgi:hypothetical protein
MKKIDMYSLSEIFPDELELAERIIFDPEYEKIILVNDDFIKEQAKYWRRENARVNRIEHWSSEKMELKQEEVNFILLRLDYMLNSKDEFAIIKE